MAYNHTTMRQQEFGDRERLILGSLDFYSYNDEVLRTIRAWEICSDLWNDGIRHVQQAISIELFQQAEEDLVAAQLEYAESFAAAATTVAADGHIPETVIPALHELIRHDDQRRRERLSHLYTRFDMPEPSDEYVHDLAMAFGDPGGETLSYNSSYVVFDRDTATEYFASRLSNQANQVLDSRRRAYERYIAAKAKHGLDNVTTRFIRNFKKRNTE